MYAFLVFFSSANAHRFDPFHASSQQCWFCIEILQLVIFNFGFGIDGELPS